MSLSNGIYHRYIYWPHEIFVPSHIQNIRWSKHAHEKAEQEGIPLCNAYNDLLPIEIEICKGKIRKIVYRHELFTWGDIVFPIVFDHNKLFATTVWITQKFDWHYTLDISKYVQG